MSLSGQVRNGLTWGYYTGYFADNVNFFTGAPSASGVVTSIPSINAGTDGYVPADQSWSNYSVQWTGYFLSNYTGSWTFYTSSDDASYLWIGPNATSGFTTANANVNNSGTHPVQERSGNVSLVAGQYYPIRIQFGENGGGDNMIVSFSNPVLTKTTNGQGFFYTAPPPAYLEGPQTKIFLGPLFSYPSSSGTAPTSDGTKLSFARASSHYLNFGPQTFDMSQGFSVTCRFAFTGTVGGYERILEFTSEPSTNTILLARSTSTGGTAAGITCGYRLASGTQYLLVYDSPVFAQDIINNIAVIYNPPVLSLYVNGSFATSRTDTSASDTRILSNCFVGQGDSGSYRFNGDIYSLNVYNRLLTPNELVGPPAPSPWGIFTSTPNGLTAAQASVSGLALKQGYPNYPSGTYWIKPTSGSVAGLAFVDMTTDGGGWTLAYETVSSQRDASGAITYSINNSSNLSALSFTRVAYSMNNFNSWAFTSFDSWSSTITDHRLPADNDRFINQRRVNNLNVISSNTNVTTGTGLNGALEIWPYNFSAGRNLSIGTYGSDGAYDINDSVLIGNNGHGSFQVHDITNFRPVICWNRHRYGETAEIGFGLNLSGVPDWTVVSGIPPTADFRVRVFVR